LDRRLVAAAVLSVSLGAERDLARAERDAARTEAAESAAQLALSAQSVSHFAQTLASARVDLQVLAAELAAAELTVTQFSRMLSDETETAAQSAFEQGTRLESERSKLSWERNKLVVERNASINHKLEVAATSSETESLKSRLRDLQASLQRAALERERNQIAAVTERALWGGEVAQLAESVGAISIRRNPALMSRPPALFAHRGGQTQALGQTQTLGQTQALGQSQGQRVGSPLTGSYGRWRGSSPDVGVGYGRYRSRGSYTPEWREGEGTARRAQAADAEPAGLDSRLRSASYGCSPLAAGVTASGYGCSPVTATDTPDGYSGGGYSGYSGGGYSGGGYGPRGSSVRETARVAERLSASEPAWTPYRSDSHGQEGVLGDGYVVAPGSALQALADRQSADRQLGEGALEGGFGGGGESAGGAFLAAATQLRTIV
ncbi:hypothetical protein T492DRAFT_433142, partial [Pavlovales sp. CCMP2436]